MEQLTPEKVKLNARFFDVVVAINNFLGMRQIFGKKLLGQS